VHTLHLRAFWHTCFYLFVGNIFFGQSGPKAQFSDWSRFCLVSYLDGRSSNNKGGGDNLQGEGIAPPTSSPFVPFHARVNLSFMV